MSQTNLNYLSFQDVIFCGEFGFMEKIGILGKTARTLRDLKRARSKKKGDAAGGSSHGHLHPGNILVSPSLKKINIQDFGFLFLKKYLSLVADYSNKSIYTPPEKLVSKGATVENPTESTDVYSLGIMLWEVLAGEKAFNGMSLKEVKSDIIEKNLRPELKESWDPKFCELLQNCWNSRPESRPDLLEISTKLESMANQ